MEGQEFRANEWVEKKLMPTTIHATLPSPAPLGPSEVKLLAPKCVQTSFMREPLWFDSCKGPPPVSSHLILSFWLFSYVQMIVVQATLLAHIKNGSACFKHFSSHISCKMNLYSGDTNKGPLDAH